MRRGTNESYGYQESYGDTSGRYGRSRRNINQRISVGNLDSMANTSHIEENGRPSSNDRSDYNIDVSESQEAPGINTNSSVFSPPINQKGAGMQRANYRSEDNPFDSGRNTNSQFPNVSPIKAGKVSDPQTLRQSDIDAINTPFPASASPIGPGSANRKYGYKSHRQGAGIMSDSDDGSEDVFIRDSDDIPRGRLQEDRSPHNKDARPRSSIMKKEWTMNQKDSELSSPKQVRFADGTKGHVEPQNLENRLKEEIQLNESRVRENNVGQNRFSYEQDEVTYQRDTNGDRSYQKEITYAKKAEYEKDYNFNRGMDNRSSSDSDYNKLQDNRRVIEYRKQNNQQENSFRNQYDDREVSYTKQKETRRQHSFDEETRYQNSFQRDSRNQHSYEEEPRKLYNYDDQPSYSREVSRKELEERASRNSANASEPYNFGKRLRSNERLSSKEMEYEREQVRQKPEIVNVTPARNITNEVVKASRAARFDTKANPPKSFGMRGIVKNQNKRKDGPGNKDIENETIAEMSSKYEESRDDNSLYKNTEASMRSRSPFNMSHQQNSSYVKENIPTRRSPQRTMKTVNRKSDYYEFNEGTNVSPRRGGDTMTSGVHVKEEIYYPRKSSPQRAEESFQRQRDVPEVIHRRVPKRAPPVEYSSPRRTSDRRAPVQVQEVEYTSPVRSPGIRQSPRSRASPRISPNHLTRSPRERPMSSPQRERKKHDESTQNNIASRFISNKMINKTIEDLVFELVPQFYSEAINGRRRAPEPPVQPRQRVSNALSPRTQGRELMNVMETMDQQDEDETDDTDEGTMANKIVESMTKKETKNNYVKKREIDSLGIKFETNKRVNGVKGLAYQDKNNYSMIDVRSKVSREKHQTMDVWCSDCFDHIQEGQEEAHMNKCRPFKRSKDSVDEDGNEIDDLPLVNEKIFKVSKAITQHLSDVMKTNAGIFDETVEIRFLRNLRQKADDIEKNNKNLIAQNQMLDSINQITNDSRSNSELYWVFIFSKRLSQLTGDKIEIMDRLEEERKMHREEIDQIRNTFADKGSLRLTTIKDTISQSINYEDVKSVMMSPYRAGGETQVDSRFVDLNIKKNNKTIRRINNSGSFSKLPM